MSTCDWEVTGEWEDTVHLLAGQKRVDINKKAPYVLPKVNKADMAGIIETIKEYCRSHHGVIRGPLAYVIRKIIIVQTFGDYPRYATPDDIMMTRMLTLPPDKKKMPFGV